MDEDKITDTKVIYYIIFELFTNLEKIKKTERSIYTHKRAEIKKVGFCQEGSKETKIGQED